MFAMLFCGESQIESFSNLDNQASIHGTKSGATSLCLFRPPKLCPPTVGGTSFGGRVSDLKTAPILGSALGRVQERVCVMVAAVEYPALCVVDNDGCVCA